MTDVFHDATDAQAAEDNETMPTGEAARRAMEELNAVEPAASKEFHIDTGEVVTQTGENPISDFTGRGNGA